MSGKETSGGKKHGGVGAVFIHNVKNSKEKTKKVVDAFFPFLKKIRYS